MKLVCLKRAQQRALLLAVSIIFQSCTAYNSMPVSLNTAVNMGPVKIIDNKGNHYKFKSVELKEGVYYGTGAVYANTNVKSTPKGMVTMLDSARYKAVYLKDKKKSKKQTIWLGIGLVLPVAFFITTVINFAIYY